MPFDIFGHANQLTIDHIGLHDVFPLLQGSHCTALKEPMHLKGTGTEYRASHANPSSNIPEGLSVHFADKRRQGGEGFLGGFGVHQAEEVDIVFLSEVPNLMEGAQFVALVQWPGKSGRKEQDFHRLKVEIN